MAINTRLVFSYVFSFQIEHRAKAIGANDNMHPRAYTQWERILVPAASFSFLSSYSIFTYIPFSRSPYSPLFFSFV